MITYVAAQQTCQLTDPDILGPYYLPGAPTSKEQLCANVPAHDRLILTGQVLDYESKCQRGVPNVKLDLWQANYNGVYSGGQNANDWWCRGIIKTDSNGKFRITTLFPGRYDDGGYRPAHIHFKVTAEGYPTLVTQLYFNLDYYLSPRDSCKRCRSNAKSLVVSAVHRDDIKTFEDTNQQSRLIVALWYFITKISMNKLYDIVTYFPSWNQTQLFTPIDINQFEMAKCIVIVRLLNFIITLWSKYPQDTI
ncbi:unnamed protein product [Rotaria sp. Silwood1]|nr:unnamed protein product [Rotaria sp. Silwood1]CAF3388543.1 unnamed protein product [Rotaria sp. Silwood1]CAF4540685.1 unnamed protein product [Rotaria sp. Silwood1]CAF4554102.1 unnamed protein product [Rotaria sp. Silwood1]CAF4890968.1 unnamed protein product [Rotaria sp. Silwood1]